MTLSWPWGQPFVHEPTGSLVARRRTKHWAKYVSALRVPDCLQRVTNSSHVSEWSCFTFRSAFTMTVHYLGASPASIKANKDGVVSVDEMASPEKVNATTSNNLELRPARWSASNRCN